MTQSRINRMLEDVRITNYGKLVVLTIAVVAVVAVVAFTSTTSTDLAAGAPEIRLDTSSGSFIYFPSQHTNSATEATEHIQAF